MPLTDKWQTQCKLGAQSEGPGFPGSPGYRRRQDTEVGHRFPPGLYWPSSGQRGKMVGKAGPLFWGPEDGGR